MKLCLETKTFIFFALLPAFLLFGLFYLIPMAGLFVSSFYQWDSIKMGAFIGNHNYLKMLRDSVFYIAVGNNLSWSLVAIFIHIPLALLVALLLSKKMRGWKVLRTVYFLPHVISVTAFAVIWTSVFNPSYGLVNAFLKAVGQGQLGRNWLYDSQWAWPVIISTWVFHIGLFAVVILSEIMSIPDELCEAAEIDGASGIKQSIFITIPMLRNILGTCVILDVTGGLRYFEGLYIMTNGAPNYHTETLALYLYQQLQLIHNSYANTLGVALLAFGAIFVAVCSKLFRLGRSDW
ncbi:MAG: carbohydrate ABC transporter permease [Bacillota bacterium]